MTVFCSERCRAIDLGKWLGEEYRIPAERADGSPDEVSLPAPTERDGE